VFEEFRQWLPNLDRLMRQGSYAVLRSCHPPITVPAWSCLASGYDAGQLGVYGFRNRRDWSYDGLSLALSTSVELPRLWDHFSAAGWRSICLGVPGTFPIVRPPKGVVVGDFLTPDKSARWCWPPELAGPIEAAAEGDYLFDVPDFRTHDKDRLLRDIYTMTRRRFRAAAYLAAEVPWDLFFMVEMGTDRIQHAFCHFCDPAHPRFPGQSNPMRWVLRDYYRELDRLVGTLLEKLPAEALVLVVSDHGARPLHGGLAINEWLVRQGYLVLNEYPPEPTPLARLKIDWPRTVAWSEGGYYARVFLNLAGREPQGVITPGQYEAWRTRLAAELQDLSGPDGLPLGTRVYRPEELFAECRGHPPDLLCYLGDLSWRSVGSVGWREVFVYENDTGPDEANHDWSGIFISRTPLQSGPGCAGELNLLDIGVSVLAHAGLAVPADTAGRPAIRWRR
jgi:predicted AlkP superfamily phosphohydrolase/phosphomutase